MEICKVSTKYQATIPFKIRKLLGIKQGDAVAYDIENGEVKLRRATLVDLAYALAVVSTLGVWDSKADDDAFGDL